MLLQLVIHWLHDRFLTWVHSFVYYVYAVCTCSRLVGDVFRLYAFSLVFPCCFSSMVLLILFLMAWVSIILRPLVYILLCLLRWYQYNVHYMFGVAVVMCSQ